MRCCWLQSCAIIAGRARRSRGRLRDATTWPGYEYRRGRGVESDGVADAATPGGLEADRTWEMSRIPATMADAPGVKERFNAGDIPLKIVSAILRPSRVGAGGVGGIP